MTAPLSIFSLPLTSACAPFDVSSHVRADEWQVETYGLPLLLAGQAGAGAASSAAAGDGGGAGGDVESRLHALSAVRLTFEPEQ